MLGRLYWVSVELEASLAPAEAEVGAVAKADQYFKVTNSFVFAKEMKQIEEIRVIYYNSLFQIITRCDTIIRQQTTDQNINQHR